MTQLYSILGCDPTASPADIKAAYRRESAKHHPDRAGGNAERMAEVNRAYAVLSDPLKRASYDQTGQDPDAGPSLQDIARQVLAQLFTQLLSSNCHDIVSSARSQLDAMRDEIDDKVRRNEVRIKHLMKRRTQVRTKRNDVPNVVHEIIDQQVQACEREISDARQHGEVQAACVAMLGDYEAVGIEPATINPYQFRAAQMGGTFGGIF